jgi:hypothetical protein
VLPRITSEAYEQQLMRLNELDEEPIASTRDEREALLDAAGADRLRLYIETKILEPKFDDPDAQMPDLSLSEADAATISTFLAERGSGPGNSLLDRIERRQKAVGAGFVIGFGVASMLFLGSWLIARLVRRQRSPRATEVGPT